MTTQTKRDIIVFIIFFALGYIIATLCSCKKKPEDIKIRFEITGKSSYTYKVGPVSKSGVVSTSFVINEIAHSGDYIECHSVVDTSNHFGVELDYYRNDRSMWNQYGKDVIAKEQL